MFSVRPTVVLLCISLTLASSSDLAAQDSTWSVDMSLGPSQVVEFETSEGTWMNLDLSPDGQTIVFDLLGDIYTMPSAGGQATLISGGAAFEVQPRFSPDGERIAFISDRGGLNNIWTMDPVGGDPVQVSEETNRDVNSPAWSPDGLYIFVRKHFVDTRSLGAGEIWMYHVEGGAGLQVTTRNGWQKDQGEPAISPDGQYLYYSKDVTGGQNFEYNKDVYSTIYAVFRRDLSTGEETRLISRPGGSITPLPSPDGNRLAFVRRVRLESFLFVRDLDTGEERALFAGLDRDMQEAWAIHGVYTQYAWTPDGSEIVIWGGGKIWRVNVATGEPQEIPFTVTVRQLVHEALRFRQEVAPEEFPVRMLRDVTTSPDGRYVAYSAMGHIYIKEMPGGEPRRVTNDNHLEFDPAFSPDGRQLVYTTWTDADKGRVRVVGADGRRGRDLVTRPGHYTEAQFSPDGATVVFRSTGGDGIRGLTYGEHRGVFTVPAAGGTPQLVTRSGSRPMFNHTGERIYLQGNREGKAALYSVDLEGHDEVVHFQSENTTDFVPSPDGRWVAFTEGYRVYLATFPHTGRTVTLGSSVKSHPIQRVSTNTGDYVHWSGDGAQIHWTMGPEYFTRGIAETFASEAAGEIAEPEAEGVAIGFTQATDIPTGVVAFTNARIITVGDAGVIEDGTLVVDGNRIVAVGNTGEVAVPSGAHVVDASGKTLMPGIVDVHAHVGGEGSGILAEASWPLMANLAFGVTTSHDPSNNTSTVFTNSEMIRAGVKLGPRLFSTGMILYGAETPFKAAVRNYDDARAHLARMQAVGAFSVKSYNQRGRNARQWIIRAARDLEMMVVPEGGSLVYNNISMILDGHTGVEHSIPVPVVYRDIATLWGESDVGYTPTMVVGYGGLSGEFYWYERTNVWENERLLSFTPRDVVDPRSRRRLMAAGDEDFNHILIGRGAKAIQDAGGLVQLGAHGQMQGLGAHWELWSFVQGGMTPLEAIQVATLNGARYLGLDQDLGSLEEGKLADIVVLSENPLDDVRNTEAVELVMINGRLYDAATLNEIGNYSNQRAPLYWER